MEQQNTEFKRNFDLASFKRASSGMVSKNDEVYGDYDYISWRSRTRTLKDLHNIKLLHDINHLLGNNFEIVPFVQLRNPNL